VIGSSSKRNNPDKEDGKEDVKSEKIVFCNTVTGQVLLERMATDFPNVP
jgi:hypothetical protein